jgi:flagellin-specific chaperone FliS
MLVRPFSAPPSIIDLTAEALFAVPGGLVLPDGLDCERDAARFDRRDPFDAFDAFDAFDRQLDHDNHQGHDGLDGLVRRDRSLDHRDLEADPHHEAGIFDRPGSLQCEPDEWALAVQALRFTLADSALHALGRARRALYNESPALQAIACNEISRACRMVTELRALAEVHDHADDPEHGTADVLCALYDFCTDRLANAVEAGDESLLDAVADVLMELRTAFSANS